MEQELLPGIAAIDLLTGIAREYAVVRAAYPTDGKHTDKWCAWKARGGEAEGRRQNKSDEVMAARWNKHPAILEYIERERSEREGLIRVDGDEVLRRIVRGVDMAMGDAAVKMVVTDKDGIAYEREVCKTDLGAAKGMLEMLAKHFRLYEDRDEKAAAPVHLTLNLAGEESSVEGG